MGHAEDLVHARSDSINGSSTGDFIFKLGAEFLASRSNLIALFAIRVPGVFGFGAGFLPEGRKGDLGEAVFDNFIARSEFIFLPIAKLFGGLLDGRSDFGDLFVGEGIIINLFPIHFFGIVTVVLGALGDEKVQVAKLLRRRIR